jgi:hypothetical protein
MPIASGPTAGFGVDALRPHRMRDNVTGLCHLEHVGEPGQVARSVEGMAMSRTSLCRWCAFIGVQVVTCHPQVGSSEYG